MNAPKISVVVPVYQCEECLRTLHERLCKVLEGLVDSFELVFVEDRGPDNAWSVLEELGTADSRVRAFRLSRNFGQHAAITAGLHQSRGEFVVVMDCDLQDPPEEIPKLYAKAQEGFHIVFARRKEKKHSWLKRSTASLYARTVGRLFGSRIDPEYGSFSMITQDVVEAYRQVNDCDRHYLFILYWLGFDHADIEFEHHDRLCGESSYSLRSLINHAFNGIFFQTTSLLHWIVMLGFAISALGITLAAYFVLAYFTRGIASEGWTSLVVLLLTLSGFIIMSTGITGLYIGKIFTQVKRRPLFVIQDRVNDGSNSQ